MSCGGIVTVPPAAAAVAMVASVSGTNRWRVTGEPFSDFGPTAPIAGNASTRISGPS